MRLPLFISLLIIEKVGLSATGPLKAKVTIELSESLPEIEVIHITMFYGSSECISFLGIYRPPELTQINRFIGNVDSIFWAVFLQEI